MKCIMVMFDSLNRHMLPPYGCEWTHAPNFSRLAKRCVTFDNSYVCSMPCMPARRDLHTGRPNFLHRSWGPLEPFDDSVPQMLHDAGVYTHLATDHYHYWEDGGATYHNRYSTFEFFRGHEGDPWIGQVAEPHWPEALGRNARRERYSRQDHVNRQFMRDEHLQPQPRTFAAGLDFIRRNHAQDKWFLQIETFDPHEPFFTQRKYKDLYPHGYQGPLFDWPDYGKVTETPEQVEHMRKEYAALLSMCDAYLGNVLDVMDELNLWQDTMLIVWTDHGFMLGEHDCWAKIWMPFYDEVAHTPFFVWDPRSGKANERRRALVQPSIDLGPTLLDFFGLERTNDMLGHALRETISSDHSVREAAIFGVFGGQVNITDGRYVYMRSATDPANQPLFNHTLMPTVMRGYLPAELLRQAQLSPPLAFTKNHPVLKIPTQSPPAWRDSLAQTRLWDLHHDPKQLHPLDDAATEQRLIDQMIHLMQQCHAPPEQFQRLGLQ